MKIYLLLNLLVGAIAPYHYTKLAFFYSTSQ